MDFAFPQSCMVCGTAVRTLLLKPAAGLTVCPVCRAKLVAEICHSCDRCGAAIGPFTTTDRGCRHCRGKTLRFKSVTCLGMYEDTLKTAILRSKWAFSNVGIRTLGGLLADGRRLPLQQLNVDVVLPIPQSCKGRLLRHFNPAQTIAGEIAGELDVPVDGHVLRRRRSPRPQKRVPVLERFANQRDSFGIRDARIVDGKCVLLVDDVLTTGATCSEATRLLKRHGAKQVHVAVLARVLDHSA